MKRRTIHLIALSLLALAGSGCRLFPPSVEPFDAMRDYTNERSAFPGAQGFGSTTVGGRGGAVLRVTTLAADGPGSLRWALEEQSGARTVLFEVGGIIDLDRPIVIHEPFVTVAGQTAPDPGITLIGAGIVVSTHDVILRHIRTRPGDRPDGPDPEDRDGIAVTGRPDGSRSVYNVVIDHCSVSWAIDEGTSTWYEGVRDVTFSNSIIAENLSRSLHPKGEHSKGLLVGDHSRRISVIGNLFAHNVRRNPLLKGNTSTIVAGNVIYNPGTQAIGFSDPERSGAARATVVGNLFLPGPDTSDWVALVQLAGATYDDLQLFVAENAAEDEAALLDDDLSRYVTSSRPVDVIPLSIPPQSGLLDSVLDHAGARPWARDATDERIVDSVRARGGSVIDSQDEVGGFPAATPTTRTLSVPSNPNGDDDGDGYTNLEEWIETF